MTLESQIEMFMEFASAGITEGSTKDYRAKLERYSKFINGRRVTKDLTREWHLSMLKEGLSKSQVNLCRHVAKRMYNWLVENELAPCNPITRIKDCIPVQARREVITLEEHERILALAKQHKDSDIWEYAVRCAWETGLRISDIAGLKWENVLFSERGIRTIPRKTKRYGKQVEIPVSDEFMAFMLAEHLKHGCPPRGYVSPDMALRYEADQNYHSNCFRTISWKARVFKGVHSYRHGAVTRWLAAGVPLAMVATMSGQNVEQVMQYCHITLAQKRQAMGLDKPDYAIRNTA